MKIEQRLLKDYGETKYPELATWLLADGTLIDGSFEGYQRDVDHRDISRYFQRSVRENPGSAYCYVIKFMRRGNIRMCCNSFGYCAELRCIPTQNQLRVLAHIMNKARRNLIQTYVEWQSKRGVSYSGRWHDYLQYLYSYTNLIPHGCEYMFEEIN